MSKRPLAALCALLAFMAVLVAVPLATAEPAEAHDVYYWKTVRTCIVDPPINHCTTERVRVPAHHKHLPATCPAGTSGTPPNCVADKPTTTTDAPPPTTQPKQCPAGSHRYGNGCHSHGFTPPSCGTGTWIPHAGHSITFLQPCPTTTTTDAPPPTTQPKQCPDGQTGTPPNCTEPNKNGKGGGSGSGGDGSGSGTNPDDDEDVILVAGMKKAWSWLSGAVKWIADNNAEVSEAEARAWEAQSDATKNAAAAATKRVVDGVEAFMMAVGESERQRYEADLASRLAIWRAWQNLNPAAQAAIGGAVCGALGGAVIVGSLGTAVVGGSAVGAGCGVLAYGSTQMPLPEMLPEGWTPPSDDSDGSGTDDGDESKAEDDDSGIPGDFNHNGRIDDYDVDKATQKWLAGQLDKNELTRIQNERDCADGWADACQALGR